MQKNAQYIYEYQKGKKIRNIGLLKIEEKPDGGIIRIYAKNMDDVEGILFKKANGETYVARWSSKINEEASAPTPDTADSYITPCSVKYEKIGRQDLSRLPRKEWKLANNSFLLHGFYNYHHLLYMEQDGEIWIGVPGVFHEKEKLAASTFGFSEFKRLVDMDLELEEEERNTYEDFGYWCRQIPHS